MKKGKKWFIKELLGHEIGDYGNYYNSGYEDGLAYALKLAHQLDEPEKVVIPLFVADWWERDDDSVQLYGGLRVKKKHKFDLVSSFHNLGLDDYLSRVEDWVDENDSAFLDLVNGKPYEVEKEKLHVVELRNDHFTNYLAYDLVYKVFFISNSQEEVLNKYKKKFTEKEIKDYDERYWPFAVEVAE